MKHESCCSASKSRTARDLARSLTLMGTLRPQPLRLKPLPTSHPREQTHRVEGRSDIEEAPHFVKGTRIDATLGPSTGFLTCERDIAEKLANSGPSIHCVAHQSTRFRAKWEAVLQGLPAELNGGETSR